MGHETRIPWIRQNDADAPHMPFLCGAAAAQMILYGRDDSRFVSPASSTLAVTAAVRRADQAATWQAVIAESAACTLPSGVHYDGAPEQDQVCETSFCWATFPKALARLIGHGVTLADGALAGVPATVRAVSSETAIENAIVASLDRGVGAALLIDGSHWVVVYKYEIDADGDAWIYYRDGLRTKVQSNAPVGRSLFESDLSSIASGVLSGKYVAVTAASSVPLVPQPHAMRMTGAHAGQQSAPDPPARSRRRRRRRRLPETRERVSLPEPIARELPRVLAKSDEWRIAFGEARTRLVLPVRLESGRGPGYYQVDCVSTRDGRQVRTGSVIVDGSTLKPVLIAGIEEPDQELEPLLDLDDARRALDVLVREASAARTAAKSATRRDADSNDPRQEGACGCDEAHAEPPPDPLSGADPASLRIAGELTWTMCDQSTSPFMPFYVVTGRDAAGKDLRLWLRADGRWVGTITHAMAGI